MNSHVNKSVLDSKANANADDTGSNPAAKASAQAPAHKSDGDFSDAVSMHITPSLATNQTHLHYLEEKKLLYYAQAAAERLAGIAEQARLRYVACLLADYDQDWMVKITHLIEADEASQNHALSEDEFMILDDVADELRKARKQMVEPGITPRLLKGLGDVFTKYTAALAKGPEYPEPDHADAHGHVDDYGKPDYEAMIKLMNAANEAVKPKPYLEPADGSGSVKQAEEKAADDVDEPPSQTDKKAGAWSLFLF